MGLAGRWVERGAHVSTHAGAISEYSRLFATSGRLHRNFHRLLIRSFLARQSVDYGLDFDLSDGDVRGMIAEGREFLDAANNYLDGGNAQDAAEQS